MLAQENTNSGPNAPQNSDQVVTFHLSDHRPGFIEQRATFMAISHPPSDRTLGFARRIAGLFGTETHPSDHRLGFIRYHVVLFEDFILHPSRIPGDNVFSKSYALGVLPLLVSGVSLLGSGLKIKNFLFKPENMALTDCWEYFAYQGKRVVYSHHEED